MGSAPQKGKSKPLHTDDEPPLTHQTATIAADEESNVTVLPLPARNARREVWNVQAMALTSNGSKSLVLGDRYSMMTPRRESLHLLLSAHQPRRHTDIRTAPNTMSGQV